MACGRRRDMPAEACNGYIALGIKRAAQLDDEKAYGAVPGDCGGPPNMIKFNSTSRFPVCVVWK
jgi:hypothetical protein